MNSAEDNVDIRLCPPTMEAWHSRGQPDREAAVLMSGGVDSSVTALLLKRDGWDLVGITMKIPAAEQCDRRRSCCGVEAAYVCQALGIPHYYVDVREAFRDIVIEPFRTAYAEGRTPSPCVDCNTLFKFGLVWDFIEANFGIVQMATGHYACVLHTGSGARLARASYTARDQSYFLYGIPRRRLDSLLLPLGSVTKSDVRSIAREARLPVARREDSMELCFAGQGDYRAALGGRSAKGPIYDQQGRVVGEHDGIACYTVGQRRGLKVAAGKPMYVTAIDAANNSITIGDYQDACRSLVRAEEVNVLIPEELAEGARLFGKIRSQQDASACTAVSVQGNEVTVEFDARQFAPTPEQRLVLYNGYGQVVAGGVIARRCRSI